MPYCSDSHFRNCASESRWLPDDWPTGESPSVARAGRAVATDAPKAAEAVPAENFSACAWACAWQWFVPGLQSSE